MSKTSKQDAFDFITMLAGSVHRVPFNDPNLQEILLTYGTYHKMCDSSSLHWWEEMWMIDGEVIAVGGMIGERASCVDRVVFIVQQSC